MHTLVAFLPLHALRPIGTIYAGHTWQPELPLDTLRTRVAKLPLHALRTRVAELPLDTLRARVADLPLRSLCARVADLPLHALRAEFPLRSLIAEFPLYALRPFRSHGPNRQIVFIMLALTASCRNLEQVVPSRDSGGKGRHDFNV